MNPVFGKTQSRLWFANIVLPTDCKQAISMVMITVINRDY